jgi:hypothetical protein
MTTGEGVGIAMSAARDGAETAGRKPLGLDCDGPFFFDEIEVAFEVVVSGYQILRLTMDSRLQDIIVVGIAADL